PVYRAEADGLGEIADSPAFRPGVNLDDVWDTLSEQEKIRAGATERFRLELDATLRRAAKPWNAPHVVAKTLTGRVLRHLGENLRSLASAYDDLMAPDTYALLLRFIDETETLVCDGLKTRVVTGVEGPALAELFQDLVEKLIYQELISRRRAMGDHGIRRICANIELAETVYASLIEAGFATLRQRLLMRIIHVHQDLGYTAYASRMSFRGGRLHRAYGARIFTDEMQRYRTLLNKDELTLARAAVATHADPNLPFRDALVLALVRGVDHTAPFAPYRPFLHLREVSGVHDFMNDLVDRARRGDHEQFVAARNAFGQYLAYETELSPVLLEDILASFRPFERLAEPVELGRLAGQIDAIRLDVEEQGTLEVVVARDPFVERYQVLFDSQQDQLVRLARASGVKLDEAGATLRLGADIDQGQGALRFEFRD
ncbi:MAG: hypothetical protein AAF658_04605, partial [Myxococcota bacterium]